MRVIAGLARGIPLQAPRSQGVRPTADRVKEAMFSSLEAEAYKRGYQPDEERPFASAVAWPVVLELYAGSGALGIEALSRGARSAELIDPDPEARRMIERNLRRTGLADRARVHALTSRQAIRTLKGRFDLVLLDPPYADPEITEVLNDLAGSGLLGPYSAIVLEHSRTFAPPKTLGEFQLIRTRRHGSGCFSLYAGDELQVISPSRSTDHFR